MESREPDDNQDNFRQASAVLEAAHHRIALLQQSLLNLTETIPSHPPPVATASSNSDVRPPHDAILLSGSTIDEQPSTSNLTLETSRVRTPLPQSVETDSPASAGTAPEAITLPPAPSGTIIRQLPPYRGAVVNLNSPSVSPPVRSWLDSQLSHRRDAANPDDPATSLGRRVAARQSGSESRQVLNTAYATIPQLQQILLESTATIARNLENLNNSLLQRVQNSDSSSSSSSSPRPDLAPIHTTVSADGRLRRSLQASGRGSQSPVGVNATQTSSSSLFPIRPPPNRRVRSVMRTDSGRQSTGTSTISPLASSSSGQSTNAARLSVLSNFSAVDNLSMPATPSSQERPILFDEPDSYVPQPPAPIEQPPEQPQRGYFIRRHVNPDGDEVVHNVFWNDSLDDPIPPAPPRQPPENPRYRWGLSDLVTVVRPPRMVDSSSETSTWPLSRPVGEVSRRRRGWARLDADGNEIPTDEEDQLERLRSENRIRAQQQSRAVTAPQTEMSSETVTSSSTTSTPGVSAGNSHAPMSRATTAAGELDATIALVRSHRREIGMLTNALDSVVSLDRTRRLSTPQRWFGPSPSNTEPLGLEDEPELFGSATPFFVDPLPMPLSIMVDKPQKLGVDESRGAGGCRVVAGRVPKHACLAGR